MTNYEVFGIVVKRYRECLINLLNRNENLGENKEIMSQKSLLVTISYLDTSLSLFPLFKLHEFGEKKICSDTKSALLILNALCD